MAVARSGALAVGARPATPPRTSAPRRTLTARTPDYIDGDVLHWQGEEQHGTDRRIVEAAHNGDEIHLFYRAIHHSAFFYYGSSQLLRYKLLSSSQPSEFVFSLTGPRPCLPDALENIASPCVIG